MLPVLGHDQLKSILRVTKRKKIIRLIILLPGVLPVQPSTPCSPAARFWYACSPAESQALTVPLVCYEQPHSSFPHPPGTASWRPPPWGPPAPWIKWPCSCNRHGLDWTYLEMRWSADWSWSLKRDERRLASDSSCWTVRDIFRADLFTIWVEWGPCSGLGSQNLSSDQNLYGFYGFFTFISISFWFNYSLQGWFLYWRVS